MDAFGRVVHGDPRGKDSWLAVHDPSGNIRLGVEEVGAVVGTPVVSEGSLELFVRPLREDGDVVNYAKPTDSTRAVLGKKACRACSGDRTGGEAVARIRIGGV